MSKIAEVFAERLKKYRKYKELSQDDLAKKMGVHRNTIIRWESGDASVTFDVVAKVAAIFEADEFEFVTERTVFFLGRLFQKAMTNLDQEALQELFDRVASAAKPEIDMAKAVIRKKRMPSSK